MYCTTVQNKVSNELSYDTWVIHVLQEVKKFHFTKGKIDGSCNSSYLKIVRKAFSILSDCFQHCHLTYVWVCVFKIINWLTFFDPKALCCISYFTDSECTYLLGERMIGDISIALADDGGMAASTNGIALPMSVVIVNYMEISKSAPRQSLHQSLPKMVESYCHLHFVVISGHFRCTKEQCLHHIYIYIYNKSF